MLWTPGKNAFFLQENLHVHRIPRLRGGEFGFGGGGGSADFIFLGGRFGPEKKYLAPHPSKFPSSPQTPSRPPQRLSPSSWDPPPPLLGFSIKNRPPPPSWAPRTPPSPSPSKKNKKYPKRPPSFMAAQIFLIDSLFFASLSVHGLHFTVYTDGFDSNAIA